MAAEAGWRVSRYLLQAEIPGSKNVAIYNTYRRSSGEYTPLDLYIMSVLDEVPEGNPFIARLAKGGLIVKFDEREALEAKRRLDCSTAHNGTVAVTICPTMACNFECPYCFASLGQGKMSPRVQDDVVSLVARMIDSARATKLNITWFGGEPLLATDVIEALSPRLIEIADKRGCAYESWIFTNGYLISPEVVEMFRRCRIGKVHIPLDGVGATNDATRRLRGGGPTFDRIMDNLGLLKPPLKTLVRANTHEGNVSQLDDLKALVMSRAAETGNRIDFYVASLIDVSPRDEQNSPMAEYAFRGIEVSLRPETRHVPVGVDHACVGQNLWMVAIDDAGYLYKCGGKLCGQPEFAYATAREWDPADPIGSASNPDMISRFLNTCTPEPDDKCYECVWLPLCGGACPQLRLFGKHKCPPYRYDPEAFVLAKHAHMIEENALSGIRG
ncbi:MAG TPA: hypothetical protein DCP91_13585 [Eggerthellaceae bacterium]|nr:hypothetical protein [Eggerthellaceae bacterium]